MRLELPWKTLFVEKCVCFHIQCLYWCCSNSASSFFFPTALWYSLLSFFLRCLSFLALASLCGNFQNLLWIWYAFFPLQLWQSLFTFILNNFFNFTSQFSWLAIDEFQSDSWCSSWNRWVYSIFKIILWKLVVFPLFFSSTWNLHMRSLWAILQSASGHVFDAINEDLHHLLAIIQ